ncbi:hypothetical protein AB0L57_22180 [Nocardia sp. NPDC052254]|uniref:hypothetical protein n=1 Tax=Nocardia sp. NPDC052254 TaxID=3155681 RepID=UPI0034454CB0
MSAEPPRTPRSGERRRSLRLLCCAAFSGVTVALLFQPWLSVSGPSGMIGSDAFGALDADSGIEDNWAGSGMQTLEISGGWAVLTCVAALVAIIATAAYLRTRMALFAHAVAVAGSAVAVSVIADVLYLYGKASELRTVADDNSVSGLVGSMLGNAPAAEQAITSHFGVAVLLAGVTAFGAAASALLNYQPVVAAERPVAVVPADAVATPAAVASTAHEPAPLVSAAAVSAAPEPAVAEAAVAEPAVAVPTPAEPEVPEPVAAEAITPEPSDDQPAYRVLEPEPSAATKEPSWRIVIPAAEMYGPTPGVRTITRAGR